MKCQSCQAISVFDPTRVAQRCDFCGSSALIPVEQIKAPIRPESLLEFKIAETQVRDKSPRVVRLAMVRAKRAQEPRADRHRPRRLHPVLDLRRAGSRRLDRRRRLLLLRDRVTTPTRKAAARRGRCEKSAGCPRPARSTTSSTTNWCPRRKASNAELLRKIEPFPTTTTSSPTIPASSAAGSSSNIRSISSPPRSTRATSWSKRPSRCAPAKSPATRSAISTSMPIFRSRPSSTSSSPVWVLSYTYGAQVYQVVINGYTGTIAGKHPLSWIKIMLAVARRDHRRAHHRRGGGRKVIG